MKREEKTRIRDLFLSPRKTYPPAEAARLTDADPDVLLQRIEAGEIDARTFYLMERRDVIRLAMERWPLETIFEALGRDAEVLPPLLRPGLLRVHAPAYVLRVLQYEAAKQGTSAGVMLLRLLRDYAADARIRNGEIDEAIPGLAAALFYPGEPR